MMVDDVLPDRILTEVEEIHEKLKSKFLTFYFLVNGRESIRKINLREASFACLGRKL